MSDVSADVRMLLDGLGCDGIEALRAGLALGDPARLVAPRRLAKMLLREFWDELVAREDEIGAALGDGDEFVELRDRVLDASALVVRSPETVDQKARRYLAEGRLTVQEIHPVSGFVVATCRGADGATYRLGYDPRKREYRCTCPSPGRARCSHVAALRVVLGR